MVAATNRLVEWANFKEKEPYRLKKEKIAKTKGVKVFRKHLRTDYEQKIM